MANGPAWHDRFPSLEFCDIYPDAFASKDMVADYFVAYAAKIAAPIRCGVEVKEVHRNVGRFGFSVETSDGVVEADRVVAATGPFQRPVIPAVVPQAARIMQIHSSAYRNPGQLPEGAVLVVGAGSSGVQIADELLGAGKRVYLSVGPHDRPPRSYRERDYCWWLGVLGKWDAAALEPGLEHVTIAVSGAHGGHTVDFRHLAARGMTLVGRTESFKDGVMRFARDLADNLAQGDANYLSVLDEADAYVARNGLDLPEEPEARKIGADPQCVANPIVELDLAGAGISLDRLGHRLCCRFQLVEGRRRRRRRQAEASARYFGGARRLFPRTTVAVSTGVLLYLGGLARRQVLGGPYFHATQVSGLQKRRETRVRKRVTQRKNVREQIYFPAGRGKQESGT